MDRGALESLTDKEREALHLLAQGYRISEIGPIMAVSQSTVETHLKSVRRRLGVSSSLLAARMVFGSVPPRKTVTEVTGMADPGRPHDEGASVPSGSAGDGEYAPTTTESHGGDVLARLFGGGGVRNGLGPAQRLAAWMLITALLAIGAFASLAIPFVVDSLRR